MLLKNVHFILLIAATGSTAQSNSNRNSNSKNQLQTLHARGPAQNIITPGIPVDGGNLGAGGPDGCVRNFIRCGAGCIFLNRKCCPNGSVYCDTVARCVELKAGGYGCCNVLPPGSVCVEAGDVSSSSSSSLSSTSSTSTSSSSSSSTSSSTSTITANSATSLPSSPSSAPTTTASKAAAAANNIVAGVGVGGAGIWQLAVGVLGYVIML